MAQPTSLVLNISQDKETVISNFLYRNNFSQSAPAHKKFTLFVRNYCYRTMGFKNSNEERRKEFVERIDSYFLSYRGCLYKAWLKGTYNKKLVRSVQVFFVLTAGSFYLYRNYNQRKQEFFLKQNEHQSNLLSSDDPFMVFIHWLNRVNDISLHLFSEYGIIVCEQAIFNSEEKICNPIYFNPLNCRKSFQAFLAEKGVTAVSNLMATTDHFCPTEEEMDNKKRNEAITLLCSVSLCFPSYKPLSKFFAGSLSILHEGLCLIPGYSWALGLDKWSRM